MTHRSWPFCAAPEKIFPTAEVLVDAGIRAIEAPLNSLRPFESIARSAKGHGHGVLIGAGTVLSAADVMRVHDAGGRLVISPKCDPGVWPLGARFTNPGQPRLPQQRRQASCSPLCAAK
ncbi:MAG: hypothetical protein JJ864_01790 [Rhizobiaceae bacterium]|nr:hypothetical protein [Rhizobiaceae bacterium]